jgi:hypothetical protein
MDFIDPKALVVGVIVAVALFAAFAFFTRAGWRRILSVLAGSLPLVLVILLYDRLAARLGWWYYPTVPGGRAPLSWYLMGALFYGGCLGLVGWRVVRRWAGRGLAGFLLALALFGVARDYLYSVTVRIIAFGSGPVPLLVDLLAYASCAALVQLVMLWLAGPPRSDGLACTGAASRT